MYTAFDLQEVAEVVGLFFLIFFSAKKSVASVAILGPFAEVIYLTVADQLQQLLQGSNEKHSKYRCWDATIAGWFL